MVNNTIYKVEWYTYLTSFDTLEKAIEYAKSIRQNKEYHVAYNTKPRITKIT